MAKKEIRQTPVDEGLKLITIYVQGLYLAEVVGKHRSIISAAMNHNVMNGKPFHFPEKDLPALNEAVRKIHDELMNLHFSFQLCDGDISQQIADVRKKFNMTYIAREMMHRSDSWLKRRTCKKPDYVKNGKEYSCYNAFLPEDVVEFNNCFGQIALELDGIELVSDIKPE